MGSPAAHRRALRRRRFAVLALVGLLLPVQMYVLALRGGAFGLDLGQVWLSATNFLHRRPLYAGDISTITFSFLPPSAALLTSPMGLVSFGVAAKALLGVQVAALVTATWFFVRRFCGERWVPLLVGAGIALALADPFVYTLQFGSVNGLVLAAMLVFFVGAADDRRWAGPLLGASLALKPILWPLVVVLLLRRQYRQVATAAAVLAGFLLVALALARDGVEFVTKVLPYVAKGEPGMEKFNVSVLGLTQQAGWPLATAVAGRLLVAGVALALCVRLWRRAPNDIDLVEAGTALVLAGIVGSSWATFYYAVFAFPALVLFSDSRARASTPIVWPFVLAVTLPITVEVEIVGNLRYLVGMSAIAGLVGLQAWRGGPPETSPVVTGRI